MDKLWIEKLRELKSRMDEHLAEKAVFESLPERTSLAALREGQRLKRNEEQIRGHFAQLAEFATGLPADSFDFRLDIETAYEKTADGKLAFGPSALIEEDPYVNFDTHILIDREEEKEEDVPESPIPKAESPQEFEPKSIAFGGEIDEKYDKPIFPALAEIGMAGVPAFMAGARVGELIERLSSVDKYVEDIVGKYVPEPTQSPESRGFYIYEGEFVYLTRKGKWSAVKTTVLAQKDYFKEIPLSASISRKHISIIEPFRELEVSEAADLISDDLAQPVASAKSDLGLGYFLPGRRIGKTEEPLGELPGIPVMGTREFAEDVTLKADSSGHPVEEISPAYIFAAGRKIDRARSFTTILRSRMQLPRTEPVRKAVESLLPEMEEIIIRARKEETRGDALTVLERDFNSMVEDRIKDFKIAARSTAPSRISPVLHEGRIEHLFETPTQDLLGIIARYQTESAGHKMPSSVLISRVFDEVLPAASESSQAPSEVVARSLLAGDAAGQLSRFGRAGERRQHLLQQSGPEEVSQASSPLSGRTVAVPSILRGSGIVGSLAGRTSAMAQDIARRGLSGVASALGIGAGEASAEQVPAGRSQVPDSDTAGGRMAGGIGSLLSRGFSRAGSLISGAPMVGGMIGSAASRAADLSQRVAGRVSGLAGRVSSAAGGFLQRAESGTSGGIGSLVSGGLSRFARRSAGLMGEIEGLIGGGARVQEEAAGGPAPGGAVQDTPSTIGIGSLPFNLPQLQRGMPKGWDRPPFEVGDAIQRHIGERMPEQAGGPAQRAGSRLQDYGLSLIDLEDERAGQVCSPLEATRDEEEVELDDDTIESIYFRLKRILETEEERMGGEA
ncbi:MAG: hypothetical protein GWO41_12260 [candidate division Zixibacteria bacterium]|nr:hypothetical protein [candidate division Zixibacteria bacterium]NIR66040.1 hypothetical protein [candidate division Zixibacteria bacterium]NIS17124.1 hypothetical protein [candidate division Zixibacteria bacterium]NIS47670.1 hypothetical protein [candidate division Zixibacteria bacterium]NIT53479.1 hypothetical protein [candidate division Zixibacteria bacterium]